MEWLVYRIPFSRPVLTGIWMSEEAQKQVAKFRRKGDPNGAFWNKFASCAEGGLPNYEFGDPPVMRSEWGGVYRFGIRSSLFRLIGFYEDDTKKDFLIFESFLKGGQKLSGPERAVIDKVARIKKDRLWKKVTDAKGYPRLAK
jgi:hypothetical protein